MRLNPPPSWPTPPEGWTPPPGWQPGPGLPPVPEGWPLWLPDDAPAGTAGASPVPTAPAVAAPTVPGWPVSAAPAPAGVPTAAPVPYPGVAPAPLGYPAPAGASGFPGQGPMPAWSASAPAPEAGRAERHGAVVLFWIGVAVFVVGGVSLVLASGDGGGFIWTGGLIVGTAMLIRSLLSYRGARRSGSPAFAARGRVGMVVGLGACVAVGVVAAVAYLVPGSVTPHATTGVGSCWVDAGGSMLEPVDCGSAHDYTGVQEVSSLDSCPLSAVMYVTSDEGGYLCLATDS